MKMNLCAGDWSVARIMAMVESWIGKSDDPEDCDVTPRMVDLTRSALVKIHAANLPRPQVWRGPSSVMLNWECELRSAPRVEKFRRVCLDVEDEPDDDGNIGCLSFFLYRHSAGESIHVGWKSETMAPLLRTVRGFLDGDSMVAVYGFTRSFRPEMFYNPDHCADYACGPYTCQTKARP